MIQGYATTEGTKTFVDAHLPGGHGKLGATGLTVSRAGFGCYRIGAQPHETALRHALLSGINLIDTSSNYTDGDSESLVGRVLADLIGSRDLTREAAIVVSKVGYLQGRNLELSRQRMQTGRPFEDVVPYDRDLAHCIHPEFIEDQLGRSLDRLGLQTVDAYLLHNPEYYLGWAAKSGISLPEARAAYYRRIRHAFEHLETEVAKGRIRCYGISSNTFPAGADTADATHLETVWEIAVSISSAHHFRMVQLPFNILESGAVLEKNQSNHRSVLDFALAEELAVLVNRPLNAFDGNHLIRLADIDNAEAKSENEIIQAIRAVTLSETRLWRKLLPELGLPAGVRLRVKEQAAIGDVLKHYWRNFGSYERFRQMRDGNFYPRIQGVMNFLHAHTENHPDIAEWITAHTGCVETAFSTVGSTYAEAAAVELSRIRQAVSAADPEWAAEATLSQQAVRVLRSTAGVSTVLVGMRKKAYVGDVIQELGRPIAQKNRTDSWQALTQNLSPLRLRANRH